MKFTLTAAGIASAILAMAASAPAVFAQAAETMILAQATDEAALAEAQALLAEAGNLQSLSEDEVKDRIQKARRLSRNDGLPEDVREQLKSFVSAARQELVSRSQQQQQPEEQQAQEPPPEPQPDAQQTEQAAPEAPAVDEAALSEAQAILAEGANLQSLSEEDLRQRIQRARRLSRNESLPQDVRDNLQSFVASARQELAGREAQQQQPQAEQPAPETQPEQQQTEQPAPEAPAADTAALSEAQAIIAESGNLQSLSEDDLKNRIQRARRLSRDESLPQDVREGLQSFVTTARQELVARSQQPAEQPAEQQAAPPPELQPDQQAAPETAPAAAVDEQALAEANKILTDTRPSAELSVEELRQRIQRARRLSRNEAVPADVREQLRGVIEASRQEIVARETKGQPGAAPAAPPPEIANVQQPAPPASEAENRAVEKPKVSNEAERKAQDFLADDTPLDRLKDEQIRTRLDAYRDLLEQGNLSRRTERRLRRKLQDERQALRARIAARSFEERKKEARRDDDDGDDRDTYTSGQVKISRIDERPSRREMQFHLNDRRPLGRLSDIELQRRVVVFRELAADERYSEDQIIYIRIEIDKARRELRRRFREGKEVRGRDLDRRRRNRDLDIDVNIDLGGGRAPPPVIWAAEEDDEEIEQQLVRRPIRRIERTYDRDDLLEEPEVILSRPEVRESLPGVEIDTIRFGFNEAFVREEEVENLDRIGAIIERVVTAHPQELFVIEGHTDAVGSDEYNLKLSRQRAEAVRQILLEFYNISEENLMTVGLGERYLKIPTPDPEQENRRVTVRRATPLLSEYDPEE